MSLENNVEEMAVLVPENNAGEINGELPEEENLPKEEAKSDNNAAEDKPVVNGVGNTNLTEEQKQRKIKCVTADDKIVEVEWYILMDCGTFATLWESLNLEDSCNKEALEDFNFPLNEIEEECFVKVVEWLRNHHGLPPIEIKYDLITGEFLQRKWFTLTDWEIAFFEIDFEFLKEIYLASNFLDIKSLYYYCAQECARGIMDKSPEEIREMLCLPDDLTEEDKAAIAAEYEYKESPSPPPVPPATLNDESEMQGTSAQFMQQSSSSVIYENGVGGSSSTTNDVAGGSGGEGNSKEIEENAEENAVEKIEEISKEDN